MLDPEFVADCPYLPAAIFFDEILEVDRDAGRLVARMPTRENLPLTELQKAHPVRHPRHVSGGLLVHVTGMLGFAHAFYLLDLRHAEGWIGYGTHIHRARWGRLARIGPPLELEVRGTKVRRIHGSVYIRYAFHFTQEGETVYDSEQGAVWQKVSAADSSFRE